MLSVIQLKQDKIEEMLKSGSSNTQRQNKMLVDKIGDRVVLCIDFGKDGIDKMFDVDGSVLDSKDVFECGSDYLLLSSHEVRRFANYCPVETFTSRSAARELAKVQTAIHGFKFKVVDVQLYSNVDRWAVVPTKMPRYHLEPVEKGVARMMMRKFKQFDEEVFSDYRNEPLHRLVANVDFETPHGKVSSGDRGGFVSGYIGGLGGSDNSWVFDDSVAVGCVFEENSVIFGGSVVFDARLYNSSVDSTKVVRSRFISSSSNLSTISDSYVTRSTVSKCIIEDTSVHESSIVVGDDNELTHVVYSSLVSANLSGGKVVDSYIATELNLSRMEVTGACVYSPSHVLMMSGVDDYRDVLIYRINNDSESVWTKSLKVTGVKDSERVEIKPKDLPKSLSAYLKERFC